MLAPTIGSKPSTGLSLGLGATVASVHGDPATTHTSSAVTGIRVSYKGQVLSGFRFNEFTAGDRWFFQGDNRFQWTSLNTYDLGIPNDASSAANLKYDWFRVYETAYRRVGSRLFIGAGINVNDHTDVRPGVSSGSSFDQAAYVTYSQTHDFAIDHQASDGTNVGILFDTRDNAINAHRGWLASATYRTFFQGFLGGDSTWQELNLDVRTYRKITPDARQKLAFWFLGDLVTAGTVPYFDLPATATDMFGRSARGYGEGRYRGPHLLYGEVEYRATVVPSGLLGVVLFLNTTTIDSEAPGQKLFQSLVIGRGIGARVLLDKRARINLCLDYGWGQQGAHGFYMALQEAF